MHTHPVLPKKVGILIINLGSPTAPTPGAVKTFLREFLSDPRVVPLAGRALTKILWQILLNGIILPIRSPRSAKKYSSIWFAKKNISPLHYYTDNIAIQLQKKFQKNTIVHSAYRYGHRPSNKLFGGGNIATEIKNLQSLGCRRIVILPLYPHYSASTIASVVDNVGAVLKKLQHQPSITFVPPYFDHPGFIALLKKSIMDEIAKTKGRQKKPDKIIFSNHGIPQSFVKAGDPYSCQAKKTSRLLKEAISEPRIDFLTSFQSRFGAAAWVKPYTADTIKQLASEGCPHLAIISPSFAVDCLETLEEINIELRAEFFKHHPEPKEATFSYIPCLNDTTATINFYEEIISPLL